MLTALVTSMAVAAAPADAAARGLLEDLAAQKFDAAVARFEPGVQKKLPAPALAQQWQMLTGSLGAFRKVADLHEESPGSRVFLAECVYEKGSLFLKVGLDEQSRVVMLRPAPGKSAEVLEGTARTIVTELSTGAFDRVVARFDARMAQGLSKDALAATWNATLQKVGAFQRIAQVRLDSRQAPHTVADVTCTFARSDLVVRVVLDGQLKLSGLWLLEAWSPPPYADPSSFEERPVTVGPQELPLPGILTLPKGSGPFPAVVLVHGSGPQDADESIGPNKLFKDLAWALATRKIAVLRYPKRTFQHKGKLSNADVPTVKEETIDDAVSAVAALAGMKEIDSKQLFVLGHSMGASLAPRIAEAEPRVHGLVMLAASARKQWHLVVEQRKYLAGLQGPPDDAGKAAIRAAEESAKKLDDPKLAPTDVVDGIAGAYWLDMRTHDDVAIAAKLGRPILLLQGERDYQVTMTDFALWKKALGKKKNVTLKSYPPLNHLFLPGAGKSTPAEYEQLGHAPVELVDELAQWLRTH